MNRGQVALRALLGPLDRRSELARERQAERFLGVHVELRAEGAADVRRDHAQLRLRDPGHHRQRHAEDVRDLGRRPHRVLALRRARLDEHTAGLHRIRDQPLLAVVLLDGHGGLGEEAVDLAVLQGPGVAVVRVELVVDFRRALVERLGDVRHGRKRLVAHVDKLCGIFRERAALGEHDGDPVAHVPRLVLRERPVGRVLRVLRDGPGAGEGAGPLVRELGGGERGDDPLGLARPRRVDARDPRVCVRAAHDDHPEHPRDGQVVRPARFAGQELRVLPARDRAADVRLGSFLGDSHLSLLSSRPRPSRP